MTKKTKRNREIDSETMDKVITEINDSILANEEPLPLDLCAFSVLAADHVLLSGRSPRLTDVTTIMSIYKMYIDDIREVVEEAWLAVTGKASPNWAVTDVIVLEWARGQILKMIRDNPVLQSSPAA